MMAQPASTFPRPATYIVQSPQMAVAGNETNRAMQYRSTFKALGIIQVVIGFLCVVLGIVVFVLIAPFTYAGTGIWAGVWYIVSGSLAFSSGTQPNSCNVTAGLVISILASVIAFVALILDALTSTGWSILGIVSLSAIHGCSSFLSAVEFVVAIIHAAVCCKSGGGQSFQGQVVSATTVTTVPVAQMHYGNLPGQQPMQYTEQQPSQYTAPQPPQYGIEKM